MSSTEPLTSTINANHNPSYPQRVHLHERPGLQKLLADVEAKIAAARQSPNASRPGSGKLLAQMAGARDQIADAVRRLPMEVGELYQEDTERVHEAEKALERLFAKLNA